MTERRLDEIEMLLGTSIDETRKQNQLLNDLLVELRTWSWDSQDETEARRRSHLWIVAGAVGVGAGLLAIAQVVI